jgi:hypothetical protein
MKDLNLVEHLKSRYMNLDLHRPALNREEVSATFYLWNLSGALVGYQVYRPLSDKVKRNDPREGRYYTYRNKSTLCVWGVESLHLKSDIVFLTEGIFDAARMTSRGYPALAVLSNNSGHDLSNWLMCLAGRRVVSVCDSGAAGRKLAKFGNYSETVPGEDSDLGSVDDAYVDYLVNKYCPG